MARLVEPAGWVTENGNGPYGTQAEALIADLGEWAEAEATKHRAEGWAAHNRKENIKEATYIGREWAFMTMQFRIRELLDTFKEGLVNSQEGPIASGLPPTLSERIREADECASVAHDFIWGRNGVTKKQANEAIWRLHAVLRPLYGEQGGD